MNELSYRKRYLRLSVTLLLGALVLLLGSLFAPTSFEQQLMQAEDALAETWHKKAPASSYRELLPAWQQLSQSASGSAELRSRSWQGWGDCLFGAEQYPEAVERYKEALRWNSANETARVNLVLARKRCPQQPPAPQSQQPSPNQRSSQDEQPPQDKQNPQDKQPSGAEQPQNAQQPPSDPKKGSDDDQVLRHLIEQERERRQAQPPMRQIPPPRGSETW